MKDPGKLYLIPNVLAENTAQQVITPQVRGVIKNTSYYLVENARTARRFISSLKMKITIENLEMGILDKKTKAHEVNQLMAPIFKGHDMGVISEAGCPGIADPGALAVAFAHQKGIQVIPLSGPSSMFLALMGSGFNGQSFAFLGYVPIEKKARIEALREIERNSSKYGSTQIFMETPFRNNHLLEDLKNTLHPNTKLCIAKNLTGTDEFIQTRTIADWKKVKIDLHKVPTVFLVYAL